MTIAERLIKIMKEKNISFYALQKHSRLNYGTIRCIVKGKTKKPQFYTLRALANVLGVTVKDLTGE